MIEIRRGRIEPAAGCGPRSLSRAFDFNRRVLDCWVAMSGYRLSYVSGEHEVKTVAVDLSVENRHTEFGLRVVVDATLTLRDSSDDNAISGFVDFVLFVRLSDQITSDANLSNDGILL